MAEVGTYYITVMPEMSKFTGSVKSALGNAGTESGESFNRSFLDIVKGSAIGTALGNLAAEAGNAIRSGISNGIERLDTLENFPRVMEAMGYSAKDAEKAIVDIQERLRGLPTASQDVVRMTQAIADSTGDLGLAKDAALGFNDMLLAQGASAGETTQAMGVFNRVLGKQNATVAQWQSLNSVLTPQMKAITEELLGEGHSVEELRDKLNDGTVSWDDFLKAIVKLDNEGNEHMGSFREQAEANSIGIGTALANVPNRIGQGWAAVFKEIGQKNISGVINDMADTAMNGLKKLAEGVAYLRDKIGETKIADNLKTLGDALGSAFSGLGGDATEAIKAFTDVAVDLIDKVLQWMADNKDLVVAAAGAMVGAFLGFKTISIATSVSDFIIKLPGIITAINTALMANPFALIAAAIMAVIVGLYTFFTQTETGRKMWEDFTNLLKETWEGLKQGFEDFVNTVKQGFETQAEVWATFKENLAQWNENIRQAVIDKWNEIKTAIADYANQMVESAKAKWEEWSTGVAEWNEGIREAIVQKWEEIKTAIADYTSQMVESARAKWEEWQTGVAEWNENIRQAVVEKWEALKAGIAEKIESVLSNASAKWEAIKTMVVDKVLSLVDRVVRGFGVMHDTAIEIVDGIKNSIVEKFEWVKEKVEGIVDFLKGIFDFEWKLPDIQLPSIDIQWNDTGFGFSVPSFSVDWYAKGGIFDAASLIGVGEAGPEAVLPLNDRTYGEIAAGIASQGGAQGGVTIKDCTFNVREDADIDRIADALSVRWLRDMGATA